MRTGITSYSAGSAPRKPCGNRKGKWGDENRRKRRISLLVLAWLCRFTYLCVKEPIIWLAVCISRNFVSKAGVCSAGTIAIAAIPIPAEKPNHEINADPAIAEHHLPVGC
jgi:hypothetical protein